jgi:hypothetical protein
LTNAYQSKAKLHDFGCGWVTGRVSALQFLKGFISNVKTLSPPTIPAPHHPNELLISTVRQPLSGLTVAAEMELSPPPPGLHWPTFGPAPVNTVGTRRMVTLLRSPYCSTPGSHLISLSNHFTPQIPGSVAASGHYASEFTAFSFY